MTLAVKDITGTADEICRGRRDQTAESCQGSFSHCHGFNSYGYTEKRYCLEIHDGVTQEQVHCVCTFEMVQPTLAYVWAASAMTY